VRWWEDGEEIEVKFKLENGEAVDVEEELAEEEDLEKV